MKMREFENSKGTDTGRGSRNGEHEFQDGSRKFRASQTQSKPFKPDLGGNETIQAVERVADCVCRMAGIARFQGAEGLEEIPLRGRVPRRRKLHAKDLAHELAAAAMVLVSTVLLEAIQMRVSGRGMIVSGPTVSVCFAAAGAWWINLRQRERT